jgi:transcriptional antiterminator NusG
MIDDHSTQPHDLEGAPDDPGSAVTPESPPVESKPAEVVEPAAEPASGPTDADAADRRQWYVLKVQSNREDTIREAILKRIKIAKLERFVGDIVVPTEKVSEIKAGKKKVTERKFFPGYIMIQLELNDEIWFTIRETPGVGDFVGAAGKPVPMAQYDVDRMLGKKQEVEQTGPRLKIRFQKGDRVKIKEGPFENFEGNVDEVIESKGLVRVVIQVFGRPAPVELEYWQVEAV